jgi:predicted nucleic acid-binding Zn ribbon protein
MPLYTYRREDGTTFDIRQSFSDEPLKTDPDSGQSVIRIVQPTQVIFKGSGFYVNDSRGKSNSTLNPPKKAEGETKESKSEAAPAATAEATKSPPATPAAAD